MHQHEQHRTLHIIRSVQCGHPVVASVCADSFARSASMLTGAAPWTLQLVPIAEAVDYLPVIREQIDEGCVVCAGIRSTLNANSARAALAEYALAEQVDPFSVLDAVRTLTHGHAQLPAEQAVHALRGLLAAGWRPPVSTDQELPELAQQQQA